MGFRHDLSRSTIDFIESKKYERTIREAQLYVLGEPRLNQANKQNVTVSLNVEVVRKARILAAKRSISISAMLAQQIEVLVNEDEAQERAALSAIHRMERGLHLGGGRLVSREELSSRHPF